MKTETTDKLGQEFLERQRQIIRDREEAGTQRDDLKAGWGKDALAKGNDNLPAPAAPFDANEAHMQLPPRLQKPAILTVEQLRQEVDNAVQDSLHQFEQDNSSLDLFYQSRRDA